MLGRTWLGVSGFECLVKLQANDRWKVGYPGWSGPVWFPDFVFFSVVSPWPVGVPQCLVASGQQNCIPSDSLAQVLQLTKQKSLHFFWLSLKSHTSSPWLQSVYYKIQKARNLIRPLVRDSRGGLWAFPLDRGEVSSWKII